MGSDYAISNYLTISSPWVERLWSFSVLRERDCKAIASKEKLPARCPKTGPRGLERSKAKGKTIGIWELESKQELERIA
ncbi:hypothetical protein GCM10028895_17240 [Pontibacter rugosus]